MSVIVALGGHRYRVDPEWSAGNGPGLGAISKVAADRRGTIYVCQRAGATVARLNPAGRVTALWSEPRMLDPHGLCAAPDGRLFVVDRDGHGVFAFAPDGSANIILGDAAAPRFGAPFNHPTDIAIAANGDIFVADGYGNSLVHRFAADGRLIRSWGGAGRAGGQFTTPHGICILSGQKVAVGDRENNRIQIFGFDGELMDIWEDVYHPMELCVDADGFVYVSDQTPRISVFAPTGQLAGRCRAPLPSVAHGMAIDADGNLYLTGPRANAIVRLSRID